jgi:hypothetical protein
MHTLELFAGSQSFSKGIKRFDQSASCVTVDLSSHFSPTHHSSILDWDYTIYPSGYFDMIWASPPCTQYSIAKTRGIRDLEGSDALVRKVLEIIDYFNPSAWIIENVGTGLLVDRMKEIRDIPMYLTDYCCYGKPVRKRTALWSNKTLNLLLCPGRGQCDQMEGKKHKSSVGNGRYEIQFKSNIPYERFIKKNAIPEKLIDQIIFQLRADFIR